MKQETLNHIAANRSTFEFWINRKERMQYSNDIFKPIIPEFNEANPSVNLEGCPSCIIDMLVWAIKELKISLGEEASADKIKKHVDGKKH